MAKIDRLLVGESLVGDGNEVAHIDLIIGPRGSAAETAFANALTNNKDGFTSLLAVVAHLVLAPRMLAVTIRSQVETVGGQIDVAGGRHGETSNPCRQKDEPF